MNGRGGTGGTASTLEAELSFGLTPDLKLSVSGPVVFQPDPLSALVRDSEYTYQRRLQCACMLAVTLTPVANPKNPTAYSEAPQKLGRTVIVQGVMEPGKDLKAPAALHVGQLK